MTYGDWEPAYARRAERMKAWEIRERLNLLEQPGAPGKATQERRD
jgi:hypothetical protein